MGEIETYDFHYNLLVIKFKSKTHLESANLNMMDYVPHLDKSFQLRPHSIKVKVGDPVIIVGRYFDKTYQLMAAPGCLRNDRCDPSNYDCKELLLASCSFTRCGDGAPLVNLCGAVIGVVYYEIGPITPFLPINIVYKWWEHYKTYKELRHPTYGFEACSLYSAYLPKIDIFKRRFPSISDGVWIEKVYTGSNAEAADLCRDDVITTCDGKTVFWSCGAVCGSRLVILWS
ncbi:hypothetical protein RND81_03G209200 [Saponaria officinalis]